MEQLQDKVEQLKKWHEEHKVVAKEVDRILPIDLQCHQMATKCCRDKGQILERRDNNLAKGSWGFIMR